MTCEERREGCLNRAAEAAYRYAGKRQENGACISTDTPSMLKHCATEVVEATEAYTQLAAAREANKENEACIFDDKKRFASELADIICCVLIIAGKEGIDIERAVCDCIEKNKRRANGTGDKL